MSTVTHYPAEVETRIVSPERFVFEVSRREAAVITALLGKTCGMGMGALFRSLVGHFPSAALAGPALSSNLFEGIPG